jgi:hypothetical protein
VTPVPQVTAAHHEQLTELQPLGRRLRRELDVCWQDYGDAIPVGDFYASIYNATPAHMLDINSAIIENPDLEVITEQGGGERRQPNTIKTSDILRLKQQRSFFPIFFDDQNGRAKK